MSLSVLPLRTTSGTPLHFLRKRFRGGGFYWKVNVAPLDHTEVARVQTKHLPPHNDCALDAFDLTYVEKHRSSVSHEELPIKVERLEFLVVCSQRTS